jgi:hypothetical protein
MAATVLLTRTAHFTGKRAGASANGAVNGFRPGVSRDRQWLSPQGTGAAARTADIVDEWGRQSFPASDPPANW